MKNTTLEDLGFIKKKHKDVFILFIANIESAYLGVTIYFSIVRKGYQIFVDGKNMNEIDDALISMELHNAITNEFKKMYQNSKEMN